MAELNQSEGVSRVPDTDAGFSSLTVPGLSSEARKRIETLLSQTGLRTDYAQKAAIPALLRTTELNDRLLIPALDMACRLGADDVHFCSTLEYGVAIAVNLAKGDIELYEKHLSFLESLARVMEEAGIDPYHPLKEGAGIMVKYLDGRHSTESVLEAAKKIGALFKKASARGLSHADLGNALPSMVHYCHSPEVLCDLLELETLFVGCFPYIKRVEYGEGIRTAQTSCLGRDALRRDLEAKGFRILNEFVTSEDRISDAYCIQGIEITYSNDGKASVDEVPTTKPFSWEFPLFKRWPFGTPLTEESEKRAALMIRRLREYFEVTGEIGRLAIQEDLLLGEYWGWELCEHYAEAVLGRVSEASEEAWQIYISRARLIAPLRGYSELYWEMEELARHELSLRSRQAFSGEGIEQLWNLCPEMLYPRITEGVLRREAAPREAIPYIESYFVFCKKLIEFFGELQVRDTPVDPKSIASDLADLCKQHNKSRSPFWFRSLARTVGPVFGKLFQKGLIRDVLCLQSAMLTAFSDDAFEVDLSWCASALERAGIADKVSSKAGDVAVSLMNDIRREIPYDYREMKDDWPLLEQDNRLELGFSTGYCPRLSRL